MLSEIGLLTLAGLAAGVVNALAGGGTLLSFPALVAIGLPPLVANLTSTVALVPGYLGATVAQREELRGQPWRLGWLFVSAVVGGMTGAMLLLHTKEAVFNALIPYLLLLAAVLLGVQEQVRAWLGRRVNAPAISEAGAIPLVFLAAVYGGYFGAGVSVILLAVLGIAFGDNLTRLNGLKQVLAFGTNAAAAAFFVLSGEVVWPVAVGMAIATIVGGFLGGQFARAVNPVLLRRIVVLLAVVLAIVYWLQQR
ncbi:sulfite exporter TauE/SafE family protein [uncultured Thermosynechococcus sp.]|uniref:sulfite exporter TauE/SafE family protein n=1 Tax=uncultured Thermosynechococcus sp. TaxID=436945 RepID=UPI0026359AF8|nr:sulfite exporter TauE/SafE family protein [uncultured Thermosynechococcus sp.]